MHFKDKFRLWSEAWICQEIFIRSVNIIEKRSHFILFGSYFKPLRILRHKRHIWYDNFTNAFILVVPEADL